jgi:hypothetical protein
MRPTAYRPKECEQLVALRGSECAEVGRHPAGFTGMAKNGCLNGLGASVVEEWTADPQPPER